MFILMYMYVFHSYYSEYYSIMFYVFLVNKCHFRHVTNKNSKNRSDVNTLIGLTGVLHNKVSCHLVKVLLHEICWSFWPIWWSLTDFTDTSVSRVYLLYSMAQIHQYGIRVHLFSKDDVVHILNITILQRICKQLVVWHHMGYSVILHFYMGTTPVWFGPRLEKKCPWSMRKMLIHNILHMRKVSSGSLLSAHLFCSNQWFY